MNTDSSKGAIATTTAQQNLAAMELARLRKELEAHKKPQITVAQLNAKSRELIADANNDARIRIARINARQRAETARERLKAAPRSSRHNNSILGDVLRNTDLLDITKWIIFFGIFAVLVITY